MSTVKKNHFSSVPVVDHFWNTERFFSKLLSNGEVLPPVNILEKKNHYIVEIAAPGFKKEDFMITTEDGFLTISAETSSEKNEEKENYTLREFSCSSFTRTFNLPQNVEQDNINAKYRDGLLSIELKKSKKKVAPKKEVKVD